MLVNLPFQDLDEREHVQDPPPSSIPYFLGKLYPKSARESWYQVFFPLFHRFSHRFSHRGLHPGAPGLGRRHALVLPRRDAKSGPCTAAGAAGIAGAVCAAILSGRWGYGWIGGSFHISWWWRLEELLILYRGIEMTLVYQSIIL